MRLAGVQEGTLLKDDNTRNLREVQSLNFCDSSNLSDTRYNQSVIHLISVEKITCYMLVLTINIIFHQKGGMC